MDRRYSRPLGQSLLRLKNPHPLHKPSSTRLETSETLFPNRCRPWQNHPAIPSRPSFAKCPRALPRASASAAKPLGNTRLLHSLLQQTNPAHRADHRSPLPMLSTADSRSQRRAVGLAFPPPEAIADTSERRLRRLKMGYRAPYLREAAKAVAKRSVNLTALNKLPYSAAKETLIQLPGVGPQNRRLRPAFRLRQTRSLPHGRLGETGAGRTLLPKLAHAPSPTPSLCRATLRPLQRLRPTIPLPLHANKMEPRNPNQPINANH